MAAEDRPHPRLTRHANLPITVRTELSVTGLDMFIFGRYQNPVARYQPIREWMNSADWDVFTARFCSVNYPNWDNLTGIQKREIANRSPYRVIMLNVRFNDDGTLSYNYVKTKVGEPLFDIETLRTCEVDSATGCAFGLPDNIREQLVQNALANLVFAGNTDKRRVIIDLYPDRPISTIHKFHKDSNDLMGASENLEYVSLMFLCPEENVTRGTVLSTGPLNPLGRNDRRETISLLCRAGTTLMFRDQSYTQAGTTIPSMIHATPQPTPIMANMLAQQNNIDFVFVPVASVAQPIDFRDDMPRLFVRVHTCLAPRIDVDFIDNGDGHPIPIHTIPIPPTPAMPPLLTMLVDDDDAIILAMRHLRGEGFTAGKRSKSKRSKSKTSKSKSENIKDVHFYCKKENYSSFCKSLTGSSISF